MKLEAMKSKIATSSTELDKKEVQGALGTTHDAHNAGARLAQAVDTGVTGGPSSRSQGRGTAHAPQGTEASMCFGCGSDNPWGLKLNFRDEGASYVAEFTPRAEYQGYPGILHGGIVCTLLDESMARMLWSRGMKLPTGKLEVRFRRPARLDGLFRVEASVVSQEGRIISCSSVLKDLTRDEVVAEGKATFLVPPQVAVKVADRESDS